MRINNPSCHGLAAHLQLSRMTAMVFATDSLEIIQSVFI
uniref:Uncharacterized protein n=1 Tax=Ascaris lumbricoides TaxID=6252 RepID=A0A0M3ITH8_ASCLU